MCGGTDLAAPQANRFAQKRVGLPAGVMAAARYLSEVTRLGARGRSPSPASTAFPI